jgi:hypothetical protein
VSPLAWSWLLGAIGVLGLWIRPRRASRGQLGIRAGLDRLRVVFYRNYRLAKEGQ